MAAAHMEEPDTLDLPVIDLDLYLASKANPANAELQDKAKAEAAKVADSLAKYGILIAKDSRASQADNDA